MDLQKMGISLMTALTIKNNDVICTVGGPAKDAGEGTGKYVGWILMNVDRWHPLLNTEPIYDTKELAQKAMDDLYKSIMEMNLDKEIKELENILDNNIQQRTKNEEKTS